MAEVVIGRYCTTIRLAEDCRLSITDQVNLNGTLPKAFWKPLWISYEYLPKILNNGCTSKFNYVRLSILSIYFFRFFFCFLLSLTMSEIHQYILVTKNNLTSDQRKLYDLVQAAGIVMHPTLFKWVEKSLGSSVF